MIVEDNHSLRDYLQLILSEKYNIITAENGLAAWEVLTSSIPSLIISDIMMPEMDGYQLLERLKSNDQFRQIPIIMLTARVELADKLKALRIGVDDYVLKPFEEEELKARVKNLLHNSSERKQSIIPKQIAIVNKIENKENANSPTSLTPQVITTQDQEWLKKLEKEVLIGLEKYDFSVVELSQSLATNRWQLNTRLKELTGLTTRQYIQETRLNRARYLLETHAIDSVKRVAYEVGMKDIKYFSRQFKQRFGKTPSAYL